MAHPPPQALRAQWIRLTGQTLAACWLVQGLLAAMITHALPIPQRPLVIDRGACSAAQWRDLLRRYSSLHLQDRLGQQRFSPVIQANALGERLTPHPPAPRQLATVALVGVQAGSRLAVLRDRYPSALLLSCSTDPSLSAPAGTPSRAAPGAAR